MQNSTSIDMRSYKLVVLLALFTSIAFFSQAQDWIDSPPKSVKGNEGPFRYYVGEGNSYSEAQFEIIKTMAAQGIVDVDLQRDREKIMQGLRRITRRGEKASIDFGRKSLELEWIDQAYARGKYYVLYSYRTNKAKGGDSPGKLGSGPFVWRSSIAPGWGQFYNRQASKGLLFSLGEVALIGGVIFSIGEASNQEDKADLALLTGNLAQFNQFDSNRKNWNTTATILGIGAGALWVLNIIDAASSDKKRYAMLQQDKGLGLLAKGNSLGFKYNF